MTGPEAGDSVPRVGDCSGTTPCEDYVLQVVAYLDDELGEVDHRVVAAHLQQCGPCHSEYDIDRIVKSLVARSCSELAPQGLLDRVRGRIREGVGDDAAGEQGASVETYVHTTYERSSGPEGTVTRASRTWVQRDER
ncbi:mycothiol system anti-sigma-R factor [Nocardioidaceae bacterium]|nr:mycothiol system anti-sigma-R factor [Nocardioidaceae bacterium]